MATNVFKNAVLANVGTTARTLYTAPSGNTCICIELDIANTTNSSISANVLLTDSSGSNTIYIIKSAPIPSGSALQVIAGQKIVLESNDYIEIQSSAANSIDAIASILQDV